MKAVKTMKEIYEEAYAQALKAGKEVGCTPMFVQYGTRGNIQTEVIEDGICGFANIKVKGNTKFGKWALANGIVHKSGMGGMVMYVNEFGQSYTRSKEFAYTFAKVLKENGIQADVNARED